MVNNKVTINLIDTPGIGDTRGVAQDKKNMVDILSHISNYDELHAIFIMLKPNDSRLTIVLRFCVQELLSHLHKDAAKNIAFIFTNTRGTLYQPGETLPNLKKLLKELTNESTGFKLEALKANIFCFDNEAFRILACALQGVQLPTNHFNYLVIGQSDCRVS